MKDNLLQGIDFRPFIKEQAKGFWGRDDLFRELSAWLANKGPRFFTIIGGPGSGKTAIASRLAQFALGIVPGPNNAPGLTKNFLSALHFCSAFDLRWSGDLRWFQPHVFSESISRQLAARYLEFGKALLEMSSHRQIILRVLQRVDKNTGHVIGIYIKHLDASQLTPEDAFSHLVREPLEKLAEKYPKEHFILLIDALDESLRYSGAKTILSLITQTSTLSEQVRFIVTTRPGSMDFDKLSALPKPQMQIYQLDQEPGLTHSLNDIYNYVLTRASQPKFSKRLARSLTPEALATGIRNRSAGNFLYTNQLLQMLTVGKNVINQKVLDALPEGLFEFYRAFLAHVLEPVLRDWAETYQPILGTLSVEREALNRQQLADIVQIERDIILPALKPIRQLLTTDDSLPPSQRTYSFYHRSLADFITDEDAAEDYWCEEVVQHERIVAFYLPACEAGSVDSQDTYGVKNLAFHLSEAAAHRKQLARHQHVVALVNLLSNPAFEQCHQAELDDPIGWREDLRYALRVVSADNDIHAPLEVIKLCTAWLDFHKKYLQPQAIFDLVKQGELNIAERRLSLFAIDNKWRQAALLAIVWASIEPQKNISRMATRQKSLRDNAEALFKRINDEPIKYSPIPLLMSRISNALYGSQLPQFELPVAPPENVAKALVDRMGGMTALSGMPSSAELLSSLVGEPLYPRQYEAFEAIRIGDKDNKSIFAAAMEAPLLVSYADQQAIQQVKVDAEHDYIGTYIRIHAANNYVRYRNGSLWMILDAVLQQHDQSWVRERVIDLVITALARGKLEYQENLPLVLLAWQAQTDTPGARAKLEAELLETQKAAEDLKPFFGKNDTLGRITRQLAGMAEVQSLVLKESDIAKKLLYRALDPVVFGFAGLYAPAALTLAEAIQISLPGKQDWIDAALAKAQQSAHHIQDAWFCAKTTSHWNAMTKRWWGVPFEASKFEKLINSFAEDPSDARFTALHHRGEKYLMRPKEDPNQFPIPLEVIQASTLAQLADIYERPLAELERVNPDDNGMQEWVNVPDPDFTPLLAARLAAEALVIDGLIDSKRVELIQRLIPLAVTNPTALDTVLSRLLLAAHPRSLGTFKDLVDAISEYQKVGLYSALDESSLR